MSQDIQKSFTKQINHNHDFISLSIGIPMYNHENTIVQTLNSIKQDIDAIIKNTSYFEVIISDNCSIDQSPQIIQEYIKQNPRMNIKYFCNETNVGAKLNIKKVVEKMQGDYVWLIGDDYFYKGGIPTALLNLNLIVDNIDILIVPFSNYACTRLYRKLSISEIEGRVMFIGGFIMKRTYYTPYMNDEQIWHNYYPMTYIFYKNYEIAKNIYSIAEPLIHFGTVLEHSQSYVRSIYNILSLLEISQNTMQNSKNKKAFFIYVLKSYFRECCILDNFYSIKYRLKYSIILANAIKENEFFYGKIFFILTAFPFVNFFIKNTILRRTIHILKMLSYYCINFISIMRESFFGGLKPGDIRFLKKQDLER